MSSGKACYLYCLAPSSRLRPFAATAIDGQAEVRVETFGEVGAVWSSVDLEEFCGEAADAKLADLAWLGPRAVRHERVIEASMVQSPVLPARFATLFTSLESLGGLIAEKREAVGDFFTTVGETREWCVKGHLDRARARERLAIARRPVEAKMSPGAQYLREKRILGEADRLVGPWAGEICRRSLPELQAWSRGFRERPARLSSAGTRIEELVNWGFLVAPELEREFAQAVGALREYGSDDGLDYSLTGPWPAYSFAPALIREVR